MSLSGGQLAGGNSATEKAENDFYATDPKTVELFLEKAMSDGAIDLPNGTVWEPACGDGHLMKVIKKYFPLCKRISTDLVYRGYGCGGIDFLKSNKKADLIITNPPFSLMNEFITHGLEQTNRYLVLFGKIQTLETVERVEILRKSPLRYVYVHSKRQATWKDGKNLDPNGKKWATTMCLAWFVWDKEYKGEPIVRWI